jgi:hypothetical protein
MEGVRCIHQAAFTPHCCTEDVDAVWRVGAALGPPMGRGPRVVCLLYGGLGAPLEEALRAEAPDLEHGRIAHAPRGADTRRIRRVEGEDSFCDLTREKCRHIVRWSLEREHCVKEGQEC